MKKSRFVVTLLLICVMCVGGSVAVFADNNSGSSSVVWDGYTMQSISVNGLDIQIPVVGSDILVSVNGYKVWVYDNPRISYLAGSSDILVQGSEWYATSYYPDGRNKWYKVSGQYSFTVDPNGVYWASCDFYVGDKLVFQKPVTPIQRAVRLLPDRMLPEIKKITIAAIGGLALLIGFLILPKKLWIFLRG